MGPVEAVKTSLSKYATFQGRASRSEYWWFTLFAVLVYAAAIALDVAIRISEDFNVLTFLVILTLAVPTISAMVRRLHDTGRSGWWYFISYIPLIGAIWLLVLLILDGEPTDNQYGRSPRWDATGAYH